jgi:glycine oxidase
MSHHTTDCIVIGGGVIGLAVARALRRDGLRVTLFERNTQPGGEASWAAAGMLAPQAEAEAPGVLFSLCTASRALYPAFADELRDETGIDIELRTEGTLLLAFTDEEVQHLVEKWAWQTGAGLRTEPLTPFEAREREPRLSETIRGALLLPDDWQVDNRRLTQALVASTFRAGVDIHCDAGDIQPVIEKGRIRGVTALGQTWHAPLVVNAAGSWAARMSPELLRLPPASVRPIHGQMLSLRMQPPDLLRHVVRSARAYLVPRRDGRLIVGATVEDVGFTKQVTAGGVARLLAGTIEAVPLLADMPLGETWNGLRPLAEDDLPILGETDVTGLFCATGHYRNGILLTPITATLMADLVASRTPSIDPLPFSPLRFSKDMNQAHS